MPGSLRISQREHWKQFYNIVSEHPMSANKTPTEIRITVRPPFRSSPAARAASVSTGTRWAPVLLAFGFLLSGCSDRQSEVLALSETFERQLQDRDEQVRELRGLAAEMSALETRIAAIDERLSKLIELAEQTTTESIASEILPAVEEMIESSLARPEVAEASELPPTESGETGDAGAATPGETPDRPQELPDTVPPTDFPGLSDPIIRNPGDVQRP